MSTYTSTVEWANDGDFAKGRYSRAHTVSFDGGISFKGSSSPHVVPLPFSAEDAVDPEEMLVAALSSCHMLVFLDLARRAGWVIERYVDVAEGTMAKTAEGKLAITQVVLRPKIDFVDKTPSAAELEHLHHQAHEGCFIASSVKTDVRMETAR